MTRQSVGKLGESAAAHYLASQGWSIVARNARCGRGEIDIVAHDGTALVFVAVRTRRGHAFGTPEESVTAAKARQLVTCATTYLAMHKHGGEWRIDFIGVDMVGERVTELRHLKHAIQL